MPRTRAQAKGNTPASAPAAAAAIPPAAVPPAQRRARAQDLDLEVCVIIE